jgi:subtilase family serine protease
MEDEMKGILSTALISAALVMGATSGAAAKVVHRSGNSFHVEACEGPAPRGAARCHAHIVTDAQGKPMVFDARLRAKPSGYGPSDLRAAYGVTGSGSASITVAIVDAYGYGNAEKDLGVYRSQYGLGACTTANGCFRKVNQSGVQGSYPVTDVGWDQEQALDLDMVSAICPSCRILLVEANSASYADLAAAVNTAAAMGAHVIGNSYGGGESGSSGFEAAYNHAGIAITVSSGDSGYGVAFPATSPHVTAVGGTSLSHANNARGWSESAWSGAGSGCSTLYAKPGWQTDTLCTMRMEADVSAVADPNTGVAVYGPISFFGFFLGTGWQVFGGTSVSAQVIGAIYGVNAGAVNYGSDPYGALSALNDVSSGSNGSCGGTYFCTAGAGYDGPTGLGTPMNVSPF